MKKLIPYGVVGVLVALIGLAGGYQFTKLARQQTAVPQGTVNTSSDAPLGDAIRDYLLQNPELMEEMQAALEIKQRDAQRVAAIQAIKFARDDIFNADFDAVVGNPAGKTTIVEFYDYNCGFCRRAMDDMVTLTSADKELRFVLKELPILGPDSQKAHVVSQAFHRLMPEKYGDFHRALLSGQSGRATEESAIRIAVALGADETALRNEMKNPAVIAALQKNYELAEMLQITGTPSYVIGDEVIFGAMGQQVLGEKIAAARAGCQTAAC